MKNKKVIIYGAGYLFEVVHKYHDLSKLNIIAVADKRFINSDENEKFCGYAICAPAKINEIKPDYVIVATKFYMEIIEDLYYGQLKNTGIRIKPLVKKPFLTILKEIWN